MAKEVDPVERKINMIAAASEALSYRRKNPKTDSERIMQHISRNVLGGKDELTKMGMVAAASEAISLIEKQPNLSEREVIRQVMGNLPHMLNNIVA